MDEEGEAGFVGSLALVIMEDEGFFDRRLDEGNIDDVR